MTKDFTELVDEFIEGHIAILTGRIPPYTLLVQKKLVSVEVLREMYPISESQTSSQPTEEYK